MNMGGKHNRWHYITWLPNLTVCIFEKKGSVNTTSAEKRHDLVRKPIWADKSMDKPIKY
jgi:hypothetical protein